MAQSDDNEAAAAASPQSSSTRRRRGKSTESSRFGSLTRKDSGKKKKKKSHTSSSGSHKSGKKSSKTATATSTTAAAAEEQQHNHSGRSRRSRSSRLRSNSKKPSRSLSVSTLNSCNSEELPQAAATAVPQPQATNNTFNLHHSSRSLAVSSDDDEEETILSQTKTKRPLRSALKPSATVSLADSTDSSITGDKGGSSSLMRPQSPTPSPLRVMRRFMAPSSPNSRRGRSKAVVVPASSSAALPLPDIVVGNKATTTRVRFDDPPATTYIEPESPLSEHEHRSKYWSKAELRQILQRVQASALQASRNDAKLLLCVHSCYGFAIDKQQQQQVLLAQQQQQQQQQQSATDAKTKDDNADDPVKVLLSSPQRALHYYFHCSITEDFTEPPLPSPEAADWAHDLTSSVTTLRGLERHISFAIVDYQMRCIQAVLEAQRLLKQQVRELQQQQDNSDDQTVEHHQRILETALSRQSTQTSLLARRFARLLGKGDAAIVGAKNGRSVVEKQQQAAAAAASSSPKTTTSHKRR